MNVILLYGDYYYENMQSFPKVNIENTEEENVVTIDKLLSTRMHNPLVKQVSVFLPTISRTEEEEEEEMQRFPVVPPAPIIRQLGIPFLDETTPDDVIYNKQLSSILSYWKNEEREDELEEREHEDREDELEERERDEELFSCRYNMVQPLRRFISVQTVEEITQADKEYNKLVIDTEKSQNAKYKV
jgi:hypothetical protein